MDKLVIWMVFAFLIRLECGKKCFIKFSLTKKCFLKITSNLEKINN